MFSRVHLSHSDGLFNSVTGYATSTGTLNLQHAYPAASTKGSSGVTATVDVNLLLSTLKTTDLQRGEWVNVIGYVDGSPETRKGRGAKVRQGGKQKEVRVQAVMVWSAGAVKLGDYEEALANRKNIPN